MTKEDLKSGMIIKTREGLFGTLKLNTANGDGIGSLEGMEDFLWIPLETINDNLSSLLNDNLDIIEIYKLPIESNIEVINLNDLTLIWSCNYSNENKIDNTYSKSVKNIKSVPPKNDELSNSKNNPTNYINHLRIISAGKNIKSIVYISVSMFLLSFVLVLLIFNSKSLESLQTYNIILSIIILLFNILILIKLFNAGDDLENVVD